MLFSYSPDVAKLGVPVPDLRVTCVRTPSVRNSLHLHSLKSRPSTLAPVSVQWESESENNGVMGRCVGEAEWMGNGCQLCQVQTETVLKTELTLMWTETACEAGPEAEA